MVKHVVDRRVSRTRATLQHSLMSLLRTKRYDAITVQDICHTANVGRSTFYAHFTSKDALKRSGLDHLRQTLLQRQRNSLAQPGNAEDRMLGFGLALFEHASQHIQVYRTLTGSRGGTVALKKIREIIAELVRNEFAPRNGDRSPQLVPQEVAVQYIVGAYMSALIWWLDNEGRVPPEEMDEMLRRLSTSGILSALLPGETAGTRS